MRSLNLPPPPRGYAPYAALVAPARARPELWRLVLGLAICEAVFALAIYGFDEGVAWISPALADEIYRGDTARGLVLQLLSYGFLGAAALFVTEKLHDRRAGDLFGPKGGNRWWLRRAFGGAMLFYVVIQFLPPWTDLEALEQVRNPLTWALTLPFGLLALLVQCGSEELLYRGYLQSQIAARFDNPAIWMVLPNVIFATVHWSNAATWSENWQYVIWAFCFGLACSDLVARSGRLVTAIGLHVANNAFAFVFFGEVRGMDSGLALFLFPEIPDLPDAPGGGDPGGPILTLQLLMELVVLALAWLSARVAVRR
ncbi:MAG: CPBP family intramembrane metalloprotease [Rhodobacteraceae bacterium]|nr:CPBP family intramembrane metalloprotease [Paracoccaceae bacterium]MBR9823201.1 CPBP family intramembrane metalloprotease [Paracoccaceae bacterium]